MSMDNIRTNPVVVWFRRDLRIEDHTALYHASLSGAPVIPLFIVDEEMLRRLPSDGAVYDFQAACLQNLGRSLNKLGGSLIIRYGSPADVHRSLISEVNPSGLFFNRDYDPFAIARDHRVCRLYESAGIPVRTYKDHVLHEPEEVLTEAGRPYVMFTPYARKWKELEPMQPFGLPSRFQTPRLQSAPLPTAAFLKKSVSVLRPAVRGGESEARRLWEAFKDRKLHRYAADRDDPSTNGTSGLSPHIRFGTISVRSIYAELAGTPSFPSGAKFLDELLWREFYQAVYFHFPHLAKKSFRSQFDALRWRKSETEFLAWKEGRTGFPLVDAGMRQLNLTGWMHNRVRMVAASFLTKDLRHHWREGEEYFGEKLLDYEPASNNGGWQWSAGTGVDPRPLRIFNPTLQAQRFDPTGAYIRRYVPELRAVPLKFLHHPSLMPPVLQKEIGCIIGKQYPSPLIDHAEAAAEYKRAYGAVQQKARSRLRTGL